MKKLNEYTDEELIEGCRKKKRHFQELVYRKYAGQMYPICLSYAANRAEAQDILQEGFLKVFTRIDSFKSEGAFGGWVRRIITNTAIDNFRKSSRQQDDYLLNDTIYEDKQQVNEILDAIGVDNILQKIAQLPKGARMVFSLYAVEGFTHKEIAQKMQISIGTSKSQFKRARDLLRIMLENES